MFPLIPNSTPWATRSPTIKEIAGHNGTGIIGQDSWSSAPVIEELILGAAAQVSGVAAKPSAGHKARLPIYWKGADASVRAPLPAPSKGRWHETRRFGADSGGADEVETSTRIEVACRRLGPGRWGCTIRAPKV